MNTTYPRQPATTSVGRATMSIEVKNIRRPPSDAKYAFAFGFLESALHRALRELDAAQSSLVHALESETMGANDIDDVCAGAASLNDARRTLRTALNELQFNHGIDLQWPEKETPDGR